jgi:hypothetical protein
LDAAGVSTGGKGVTGAGFPPPRDLERDWRTLLNMIVKFWGAG